VVIRSCLIFVGFLLPPVILFSIMANAMHNASVEKNDNDVYSMSREPAMLFP